ncbi:MAG: hypothetical protein ACXV5F_08295 [Halobacteriota archaeon]
MKISWRVYFGLLLIALSALLYTVHFLIFQDLYHIQIYLLGDLAFVPIEVLLVVLVVDRVISYQERRNQLEKLNMAIGTYFSEVGTPLLKAFSDFDPNVGRIRDELMVTDQWTDSTFADVSARLKKNEYTIIYKKGDPEALAFLEGLRRFLVSKRAFLLRMLENPNLLEHESFTDQLWAVFHLADEFEYRRDLVHLPDTDYQHLAHDSERAYRALIVEWLKYMEHLKTRYPYLFSLALRTNPFDKTASPIVTK